MKEKEQFYIKIQKFLDAGLMKEIYANDNFAIYNISNSCYAIYDYQISHDMGMPVGFVLEAAYLKSVIQDNSRFYSWIEKIPENERNNHIIYCGDKTFEAMKKRKQETDLNGPLVNLEYEEQLLKEFGNSSYGYR